MELAQNPMVIAGLLAGVLLALLVFALDIRAAYRSADPESHAAAAATIGQLLVVGWAITGLITVVAIWHGRVGAAVGGASLFWLVSAASTRFARSCQAWERRHAQSVQ
ncbi:MAG: hypothetical protein DIU80_012875 [Chloroflexota bacterium]